MEVKFGGESPLNKGDSFVRLKLKIKDWLDRQEKCSKFNVILEPLNKENVPDLYKVRREEIIFEEPKNKGYVFNYDIIKEVTFNKNEGFTRYYNCTLLPRPSGHRPPDVILPESKLKIWAPLPLFECVKKLLTEMQEPETKITEAVSSPGRVIYLSDEEESEESDVTLSSSSTSDLKECLNNDRIVNNEGVDRGYHSIRTSLLSPSSTNCDSEVIEIM